MRFKKIEIKNYKGINRLVLDFDKEPKSKVFTLVGLNESGKTSILEAIDLLSRLIPEENRHELIPKSKKINFNDYVRVDGVISVEPKDLTTILAHLQTLDDSILEIEPLNEIMVTASYSFVNSTPKFGVRYFTVDLSVKKKRSKKFTKLQKPLDKSIEKFIDTYLVPKILFYPNFLHEFPNQIVIANESGELTSNFYTHIIQDILHSIEGTLSIEEHLLKRMINDKKSDREALDSTLNKMSAIVTNKVFKAWGKLFKVGSKEIIITTGDRKNERTDKLEYYLEFKLKEGSDKFNISERSLGFKWFFTFLLFTEFRKNRATETGEILFLLDEPASNLHSTAQKNLIETFKEITSKSILVYTTHSHHLINPEWLNGAYIVRNKAINYDDEFNYDSSNTDIEALPYKQFVAKYPNDTDYFQPILDTLDYNPGLLEKVPNIIITEGKNDYYSIKILERALNTDRPLNIFPGTGADKLYDIISLYLAWNRPFIVSLDSDKGGEKAKKDYLTTYGVELNNRIFTLNDVDKTWKDATIEHLFSEEDQIKFTKEFDDKAEKFHKSKFNTSLQNLFFETDVASKFSTKTKSNFTKLIAFLNDKLAGINNETGV